MAFANIKCPECGHIQKIEIPKNKCLPFYKCEGCGKIISSKKLCCVICEFSDRECPVSHKI